MTNDTYKTVIICSPNVGALEQTFLVPLHSETVSDIKFLQTHMHLARDSDVMFLANITNNRNTAG
jgi:hypothetical protein